MPVKLGVCVADDPGVQSICQMNLAVPTVAGFSGWVGCLCAILTLLNADCRLLLLHAVTTTMHVAHSLTSALSTVSRAPTQVEDASKL